MMEIDLLYSLGNVQMKVKGLRLRRSCVFDVTRMEDVSSNK